MWFHEYSLLNSSDGLSFATHEGKLILVHNSINNALQNIRAVFG